MNALLAAIISLMSLFLTILTLFVLGILGLYLLKIAKGIAYVVFLLALGFGLYRFTETYIVHRSIDIPTEIMALKKKWFDTSSSELQKTLQGSGSNDLTMKVKQDLSDMASKKIGDIGNATLPLATDIASSALKGAAADNSGFFITVKNSIMELLRDIQSNVEKL